ncbi:hypothetical protein [Streptosporangium longisporum]|uniref:hypothetical protein n=1 Tax=Streptosporangium longisporum TaxID=46187 RepID=UPI003CD0BF43
MVRVARAPLPLPAGVTAAAIVNTCSIAGPPAAAAGPVLLHQVGAVLSMTRAMAADLVAEGVPRQLRQPGHTRHPVVSRLLEAAPTPRRSAGRSPPASRWAASGLGRRGVPRPSRTWRASVRLDHRAPHLRRGRRHARLFGADEHRKERP